MKELKQIKLKDILDQYTLNVDQLSKINGGIGMRDGCKTGICDNNRSYGSDQFCKTTATCTSGVSTCRYSTDPD